MRKNIWTIVSSLLLGLLPLLLIGCGSGGTATTTAPTKTEETEEGMGETAVSDEILPVSAKPQLIEFYADW